MLHGAGVGGGSLGYANVLMEPEEAAFQTAAWRTPVDWGTVLRPHYATARRMLGVAVNPRLGPADFVLQEIATELGQAETFRPVPVGTFFGAPGEEGREVPDPYFGGEGPPRSGCIHCGGCMVGCRHNAKNTLVKNYLWFAERRGAEIRADSEVRDIRPLTAGQPDGARYEVLVRRAGGWPPASTSRIRARNVIVSAGTLGTLRLLFRCRDVTRSLPAPLATARRDGAHQQRGAPRQREPHRRHRLLHRDRHHLHLPGRPRSPPSSRSGIPPGLPRCASSAAR